MENLKTQTGERITSESAPHASVRSLRELIDMVSGRGMMEEIPQEDSTFAEQLPFPFLALVGQVEMKLALLFALINPTVGGVLLLGPRGTGKTTAVRGLVSLLPDVERSSCFYGCLPDDIESGGIDAVCPDCARKYGEGKPLTVLDKVHLVELPLNAKLEDVIGGLDERALVNQRMRLKRGLLSQADLNILYVDEVNLLADDIVDAILDASALGSYTVKRGPVSASYNARFTLIGSMNPEEGNLRPQIMDRFGLRVIVRGLIEPDQRLEAYRRVRAYHNSPRQVIAKFSEETKLLRTEILAARALLSEVQIPPEVAHLGISLVQRFQVDSLRAEITLFEAARACAAADGRSVVNFHDFRLVAPMALRLRRSEFMKSYFAEQSAEEDELKGLIDKVSKLDSK